MGKVGLRNGNAAGGEHSLELETRIHAFPSRQRDGSLLRQARISLVLLCEHGLLDKERTVWLELAEQHAHALGVFLSLTTGFADLANVWMLTAGRIIFPVIGTQAYWLAIGAGQFGPASALSLLLVPFLLAALVVLFRLFEPPDREPA